MDLKNNVEWKKQVAEDIEIDMYVNLKSTYENSMHQYI